MFNKAFAGLQKFGRALQGAQAAEAATSCAQPVSSTELVIDTTVRSAAAALLTALGGTTNILDLKAVAFTRLRVELADTSRFDEPGARLCGAAAVMQVAPRVLHLIVGDKAAQFAAVLSGG
jgi:phosphotransferase system IIB component